MAPERFDGRSDGRCDIYALGVTLYEMLALRPAFDDPDRARLIRRILDHEPPPLRKIDPRIPLDLETVVHKAMAREPADRFATAAELAAELRRVAANQPIRSRRIPWREQSWRWCKRNPNAALLAALFVAALALGSAASTAFAVRADAMAAKAKRRRDQAITTLNHMKILTAEWACELGRSGSCRPNVP